MISAAVDQVLETMFFSTPLGPAESESEGAVIEARVAFQGRPSGALAVRLSAASAGMLAAGFLGETEEALTDCEANAVVCELANMLCGSLVSKLEGEESFDLTSPELAPAGSNVLKFVPVARKSFEVENGVLTVTLHLEAAA